MEVLRTGPFLFGGQTRVNILLFKILLGSFGVKGPSNGQPNGNLGTDAFTKIPKMA